MKPGAFTGGAGGCEDNEDGFLKRSSGLGGTGTTAQLMLNRVLNPATILLITNFGFAPACFCIIIRLGGGLFPSSCYTKRARVRTANTRA